MSFSETLLPEFDHEMANTRKCLERIPAETFDWRPHEKSGTMGWLATHVATLPGFGIAIVSHDGLDIANWKGPKAPATTEELVALFDATSAESRAAIAGASDGHLAGLWTLRNGDAEIFSMPRTTLLRNFMLNHIIHHRAQLTMYMRLKNIPVPALYGPSADEGF